MRPERGISSPILVSFYQFFLIRELYLTGVTRNVSLLYRFFVLYERVDYAAPYCRRSVLSSSPEPFQSGHHEFAGELVTCPTEQVPTNSSFTRKHANCICSSSVSRINSGTPEKKNFSNWSTFASSCSVKVLNDVFPELYLAYY